LGGRTVFPKNKGAEGLIAASGTSFGPSEGGPQIRTGSNALRKLMLEIDANCKDNPARSVPESGWRVPRFKYRSPERARSQFCRTPLRRAKGRRPLRGPIRRGIKGPPAPKSSLNQSLLMPSWIRRNPHARHLPLRSLWPRSKNQQRYQEGNRDDEVHRINLTTLKSGLKNKPTPKDAVIQGRMEQPSTSSSSLIFFFFPNTYHADTHTGRISPIKKASSTPSAAQSWWSKLAKGNHVAAKPTAAVTRIRICALRLTRIIDAHKPATCRGHIDRAPSPITKGNGRIGGVGTSNKSSTKVYGTKPGWRSLCDKSPSPTIANRTGPEKVRKMRSSWRAVICGGGGGANRCVALNVSVARAC